MIQMRRSLIAIAVALVAVRVVYWLMNAELVKPLCNHPIETCPQRKGSSSTSHARNQFNLNFFDSAQCLMVRRWRLIGHFPILYNPIETILNCNHRVLNPC
jgi:hypothetical protein